MVPLLKPEDTSRKACLSNADTSMRIHSNIFNVSGVFLRDLSHLSILPVRTWPTISDAIMQWQKTNNLLH